MPDVSHVADVTCNAVVPPLSRQCLIHTRGREFRSARGLEAVEPRATHTRYNARRPTVRRHHLALFFSSSFVSFRSALHSTQLTESSPSRVESESSLSGVESVLSSGMAKTIASRFFFSPTVQREFNDSAGFERLASPSRNHRFNGTDFVQVQVETDLWNRPRLAISPSNCENRDRIGFPLLFLSIFLSFSFAKLASILRPRSAGPILFTQFPIPKSRSLSLSLSRSRCCFFYPWYLHAVLRTSSC